MDHLAQIKADEQRVKDAMKRGDLRVPLPRQFTPQQLGLREVMVDENGQLWMVGDRELMMVVR